MHLTTYLTMLQQAEQTLAAGCRVVSDRHPADAAVHFMLARFADQCAEHGDALTPILARSGPATETEPERLHPQGLTAARSGAIGLLRDLLDLYQLTSLIDVTWTMVGQAAHGARDRDLIKIVNGCTAQTSTQLGWLRMIMKSTAPQTLLVAD